MAENPRIYLFYGDDDMALEEALKKIHASMGADDMNTDTYEGADVSVDKVLNAVCSFPFLADKRLVIVRGFVTHLMKNASGKAQLERLIDEIPKLPNHARLVLVEREKLRSDLRIVKAANEHGFCREYKLPDESSQWILQRAKNEYHAAIEQQAALALASVVGNDLRRADNELVKLVSYVAGERPISEADVALLTPYVAEANVFDLVESLANGDGKKAFSLMKTTLEQKPEDPGFGLFALIVRQFRLLLLVREYLDNGGSANNNAIAKALGIHPFPAGKLAVQSRKFTLADLERIYRYLQGYDFDVKTGRITIDFALELLIARLAKG